MGPKQSVNNYSLPDMSLLKVESRNTQLCLNHVFKIVNDKCPSYTKDNFKFVKMYTLIILGQICIIFVYQITVERIMLLWFTVL